MAGRDNKAYRDDLAAVFFGDMLAKCFILFYFLKIIYQKELVTSHFPSVDVIVLRNKYI